MHLSLSQSRKGSSLAKFLGPLRLTMSLSSTTVGLYDTTSSSLDMSSSSVWASSPIYIYVDEYLWTLRPHKTHFNLYRFGMKLPSKSTKMGRNGQNKPRTPRYLGWYESAQLLYSSETLFFFFEKTVRKFY